MCFQEVTKSFFIFILVLATWAFFEILSSYFSAILWAAILTVIFNPLKNKLREILGNRNRLAVITTIVIICLIVFIPLMMIISSLAIELNLVYVKLQQNNLRLLEEIVSILKYLPEWVITFLTEQNLINGALILKKISEAVLHGGQHLAGSAFLIGKGTFSFVISFSIMLYLLFFLLKDGPFLVCKVLDVLPLSNFAKQHLFSKFVSVSRSTVKSTLVVAVVQGILGSIAFSIIDIDGSMMLWGVIMAFLSLLPAIGSAIVWIPTSIYLFSTNHLWQAMFIIIFFVLIIGLVDNFLRPLLVGKDTKMPDYLILISTLGGIEQYGINGFVIGPLIASLFIACWNLFSRRYYYVENSEKVDADFIKEEKNNLS